MSPTEPGGDPTGTPGLEPSTTPALHPDRRQARMYLELIGIGAAIGIPAAVLAKLFLAVVHWAETWLWTDLPDALGESSPPWYLVLGLPVAGAGLVAVARAFLPGDGGHSPLHGLGGPPTPWQYGPSVLLAAFGTLAFGAVLGPEAPLIALGSVVGMAAASWAKPGPQGEQVLATAGSFSAVSALFGGPLVAGILLLEAGLAAGAALLPALLPGLVAAAVGYVVFIGLGDWGGLDSTSLVVPDLPAYDTTSVPDLLMAIVVGVLTALLIGSVKRFAHRVDDVAVLSPRNRYGVLLAGGLVIGLITLVAQALGAGYDDVLFSGQSAIPQELAENSAGVLLVILVAKALAYAICLGCGFRGGPVFPAVFLGVGLATFACIWFDTSITWALAVGAAAGMTAGTGLVFSGLVLSLLLVGVNGLDALPAAVLAVVAAWLTNSALERRAAAGQEAGT
ncbi:chloride channel protein [Nocardioides guangzhouensis]|uniref:Chloride channel protein n=1 Tax=Nocardioides guangzhouensis TaxID=2497878 RepID=A0A4Q4ZIR0_9ACTN|nr:chloride channel protein [Nocardioides guangzhouensis]RYP87795.1 chloride channel protein [Nocardioides guangzhouensis]